MTPALSWRRRPTVAERYAYASGVRSLHQAASGISPEYNAATGKVPTLPPEQAMVFAEPDSAAVYLLASLRHGGEKSCWKTSRWSNLASGSGKGVGWGAIRVAVSVLHDRTLLSPRLSENNLVGSWLPTLDGVAAKLESPARKWLTLVAVTAF